MYRLHSGLRSAGIDSKILCERKTTESAHVTVIPRRRKVEAWLKKVTSRLGLNDIHCVSSFRISSNSEYLDADIVHIHGIHSGFFSYLALPKLTRDKPTVFTTHDMWPMTGHCAINYDCERWEIGCGKCPYLDAHPSIQRDGTSIEWKLKNWVYKRSNLTIVSPSSCYAARAKQSMLSRFSIHHIPNGVDTEIYYPRDPDLCRSVLGISPGKRVLMFAALLLNQFNKGGDLLLKALQRLPESLKNETTLLLLGNKGQAVAEAVGMQAVDLGYIGSDHLKTIAYSAADVFVSPTRAEAFPLVLLESSACGTPVVSFNVGGVPDIVRPGVTGYLAEPEDANDLSRGIVQLLEDEDQRNFMSEQVRFIAQEEYNMPLYVQRHIDLYRKLTTG